LIAMPASAAAQMPASVTAGAAPCIGSMKAV
jgi:hypothetical protein